MSAAVLALLVVAVNGSQAQTPLTPSPHPNAAAGMALTLDPPVIPIWEGGSGEGLRSSVQTLSFEAGAAYGPAMMGSLQHHHLALLSFSYGHMVGSVLGESHWWGGILEVRAELFGGMQFSPHLDWLAGLTPHVRYNFATGKRWMPFLDGGVGVSLTGIGPPDLGSLFEFNLQGCAGVHWFLRDNLALTTEGRCIHLSCAGISDQNYGLNAVVGLVGLTLFYR